MPSFLLLIAWQAKHKACLLSHDHTSPPSLMGMMWSDTTASMASPSSKQVAQSGFSCLCALLSFLHCELLYSLLSSLNLERWKALATIDQGCFFCFLLTVGINLILEWYVCGWACFALWLSLCRCCLTSFYTVFAILCPFWGTSSFVSLSTCEVFATCCHSDVLRIGLLMVLYFSSIATNT